jgi:hypothetical protein
MFMLSGKWAHANETLDHLQKNMHLISLECSILKFIDSPIPAIFVSYPNPNLK